MSSQMSHRARILAALEHRPVDRIPVDLGGTHNSTVCTGAYERFKAFPGIDAPTNEVSPAFVTVQMDLRVLDRLPVDTRPIFARLPAQPVIPWLDQSTFVDEFRTD